MLETKEIISEKEINSKIVKKQKDKYSKRRV